MTEDDTELEQKNTTASDQPTADDAGDEDMDLSAALSKAMASAGKSDPAAEDGGEEPAKEAEATEDEASEDAAEPSDDDGEKKAEQPAEPAAEAPRHWPEERRQAFAKASPEVRAAWVGQIKDLEAGVTRKFQELSQVAKIGEGVRQSFTAEHKALMQQNGLDEAAAVKQLVDLWTFARANPRGYVQWFASNAGIDLGGFGQPQKERTPANKALEDLFRDPDVAPLKERLGEIEKLVSAERAARAREIAAHERERIRELESVVEEFVSQTDESGLPAHPHFELLKEDISVLLNGPRLKGMPDGPEKLKAAYEMAVYAVPALRERMVEAEVARRREVAEKKAAAKRARVAATPRATPAPAQVRATDNLDEALEAALARHTT